MAKYKIKLYLFSCLVVSITCQTPWDHPHKQHDKIGRSDKNKLIALSDDLTKASSLMLRQLNLVRKEHESLAAFHVGLIIGKIREKYRTMIEIYKDIVDKKAGRFKIFPPGIHTVRVLHYVLALEMTHYLELEIDRLVDALETVGKESLKGKNMFVDLHKRERPSSGPGRAGREYSEDELNQLRAQQQIKSKMREQYLMRKLGQSENVSTTKKRFLRQWPVEDTWSLMDSYT